MFKSLDLCIPQERDTLDCQPDDTELSRAGLLSTCVGEEDVVIKEEEC
jgi:hypothetical protein